MLPGFTVNLGAQLVQQVIAGGGANPPVFLASASAVASTTNSCTISSFTAAAGSVIVLMSGAENPAATITSIGGTLGLSWTRRAMINNATGYNSTAQSLEIWYAINSSGSAVTGSIIATYTGYFDDQAMLVSSFSGCNLSNPWSTNATYSATGAPSTIPTITGFSTTQAKSLGLWFCGNAYFNANYAQYPWTNLGSATNSGASYWEFIYMSYQSFTTQQSGVTISSGVTQSSSGWIAFADSLVS
jgi:hypothetical protein